MRAHRLAISQSPSGSEAISSRTALRTFSCLFMSASGVLSVGAGARTMPNGSGPLVRPPTPSHPRCESYSPEWARVCLNVPSFCRTIPPRLVIRLPWSAGVTFCTRLQETEAPQLGGASFLRGAVHSHVIKNAPLTHGYFPLAFSGQFLGNM